MSTVGYARESTHNKKIVTNKRINRQLGGLVWVRQKKKDVEGEGKDIKRYFSKIEKYWEFIQIKTKE